MNKKIEELTEDDLDKINIGELISQLNRYFSIFVDKKLSEFNITRSQAQFLMILNRKDHISQEEICNILHMTEGTVARTIKRLEDKNFVTREINPNDKRKKVVIITENGRQTVNNIVKNNLGMKEKLEDNISQDELRSFTLTILKIIKIIEQK